jgi:hypothetical protein
MAESIVTPPVRTRIGQTKIIVGQVYGLLTVLAVHPGTRSRGLRVDVRCECGTEKQLFSSLLLQGKSRSCGCKTAEWKSAKKKTHGRSDDYLHDIWQSVKNRCFNKNDESYQRYGARGITICDEWRYSFAAFALGVGERPSDRHSLDRINPRGPYAPGNTRWATSVEQRANQLPTWGNLLTAMRWGFYSVTLTVTIRR